MAGEPTPLRMIGSNVSGSPAAAGTRFEADGSGGWTEYTDTGETTESGILPDPPILDAHVDGLFGSVGAAVPDAEPGDVRRVGATDESVAHTQGSYYDPLNTALLDELFPA
jgi:hypothetical protein